MASDDVLIGLSQQIGKLTANSENVAKEIGCIRVQLEAIEVRLDAEAKEFNYTRGKVAVMYAAIGGVIACVGDRLLLFFK